MKRVKVSQKNYPRWTCGECAIKAGGIWPEGHVGTFHMNICPVCGEHKSVTEPRDYRYPKYKTVIDPKELSSEYLP